MSLIKMLDFKSLGDERGNLISLEGNKDIPFDIKRVYYLFGTEIGIERGFHAHKELQQVAICVSGSCKVRMDNGVNRTEVTLNQPEQGLLIDCMQWHEMYNFSENCVFLVLASDHYDESDYIRCYEQFIEIIEKLND
jgi:dTDP-4-dehydrorhamnose 3,5-epimerase-like enzyme